MGGSGSGGYFYNNNPEDLAKKIRQEEEVASAMAFESNVNNLIRNLLSNANSRDTYKIQTHLNIIENAIHSEIDGVVDLRYAGSVSKHTYVDGLSDIDCLAILDNSELSNSSPDEVKQYFFEMLSKRLPNTEIRIGKLAVTVAFSGIEIQVLPALKRNDGIKIPSSRRENSWSHVVRPTEFAKVLRYMNARMSGKLVPVIKLAKSIIDANFNDNRKVAGYHTEALAIETFANYKGQHNYRAMLKHFFIEGAKNILLPIKDKSGQSVHVDDYLNEAYSLQRKMISDSMSSIGRKMQNADGIGEIRIWEQLLS